MKKTINKTMSEKKQTALAELIKEMESLLDKPYINPKNALNDCIHLAYAKLEMEREQIIEAVNWGANEDPILGEQFYKETYGK